MQYSFRLAELLGHAPDPKRRPGTIKAIVEYTGLDRHQVAALLKNEVKYIPLKALSRLCDFLVEHGHTTADQLPGALFSVEPENFWELLARRRRLELCLGVRQDVEQDNPEVSYVVASDSVLMGELLNGVTSLGGTAKLQKATDSVGGDVWGQERRIPHPDHLKQLLVWSPGQAADAEMKRLAKQTYRDFSESAGDKALVCLGSTKSNPVVEIVMANAFGASPFESQDGIAAPDQRACPVYFRYRDNDPHPDSCVGGVNLHRGEKDFAPGIYYEDKDGEWKQINSEGNGQNVAMVFYIHRESQGRLEMALGGFSGRATRLLARALATKADDFWPPVYTGQGIQMGLFLVEFVMNKRGKKHDILRTDLVASTHVTPISCEAIERRLGARAVPTTDELPKFADE